MNITPSDMDVGQGFSLADTPAAKAVVRQAGASSGQQQSAGATSIGTSEDTDVQSRNVAEAADRTAAREAAQKLEKQLGDAGTGLKIRVLDDSQNRVQVEIVDRQSNKILRKIPQDELLKLSASIKEMSGVLLNSPA